MPKILLLSTGGTFDKTYNPITGVLGFEKYHTPEILKQGRVRVPVRLQTLMLKDSLDLTDADRKTIVTACQKAKEKHIVITHGTDTMTLSASALAAADLKNKTIVLTGAMIPYSISNSDAIFNLGVAVAFAQTLPAGVYIAMNGKAFAWDKVVKNKKCGWFE